MVLLWTVRRAVRLMGTFSNGSQRDRKRMPQGLSLGLSFFSRDIPDSILRSRQRSPERAVCSSDFLPSSQSFCDCGDTGSGNGVTRYTVSSRIRRTPLERYRQSLAGRAEGPEARRSRSMASARPRLQRFASAADDFRQGGAPR